MLPRLFLVLSTWGVLQGLLPGPAMASEKPLVAVLYFDNDTGDASFDVLQKGFADMVITDFSESDALTVVERDKLQAVIGELTLQRSKYFDPKTAVRIGKQLGARYLVSGSFVAVKPRVRVNARMFDVKTGSVVLGSSVTGTPDEIFELEQDLVRKMLAGLQLKLDDSSARKTRVPNLDTLLDYSKAVDLADRGDYERAAQSMKQVVSSAPTFALARVRRAELLRRYQESQERKVVGARQSEAELLRRSRAFLASHDLAQIDEDQASRYLGYRLIFDALLSRELERALTGGKLQPRWLPKDKKEHKRALALAQARLAAAYDTLAAVKAYDTRFQRGTSGSTRVSIDADDRHLIELSKLSVDSYLDEGQATETVIRFTLLGSDRDAKLSMAPPIGFLDARAGQKARALLSSATSREVKRARQDRLRERSAANFIELWADVLFFEGKRDQAVAKLQEIVDQFPTQAGNAERRIEGELGLRHDHYRAGRERFAKGLKTCDFMDINVGLIPVSSDRIDRDGFQGMLDLVKEVERACKGAKHMDQIQQLLYRSTALEAGGRGFCTEFDRYMALAMTKGLPKSDAAGYRKNYTPCDTP